MRNLVYFVFGIGETTRTIKLILFRVFQIEIMITQMSAIHINIGIRFLKWEFDPTFRLYRNWLIELPKLVKE